MKTAVLPTLLIALALAPAPSWAAEGWFGGLNLAPWINRADALLNLDRGDAGQRKRVGSLMPASRRVDVELGFGDSSSDGGDGVTGGGRNTQPGRNFRLAGVGTWPLGDSVGLTGRVGAYRGDIEMQNAYRITPDASLHPTFGMGVRYDFSANLRLQGGWDRYHLGGSLRPGDGGVDLLTIGLKYRF